jgi:hypothetical protein
MVLLGCSGARGTLIYEKNLKAKISCQTPFNSTRYIYQGYSRRRRINKDDSSLHIEFTVFGLFDARV